MFRKIEDFLGSWAYENEATAKILANLTDESLIQRASPDSRTLGRIAWHIVVTLPEMGGRTGLEIPGPSEDAPVPTSAEEIGARFKKAADAIAREIQSRWTDEDLAIEDDMYGQSWTRSQTLAALVNHQIHHRGQMTILMRMAGLKVPGMYGPALEEWADYGMPAPE